jgi:hypothetical protein
LVAAIAVAAVITMPAWAGSGTLTESQWLVAPDGREDSMFGTSVSVDVDASAIGAPGAQVGAEAGAVYTYTRNEARTWIKEHKLTPSDGQQGDEFGAAVALDDDILIAGAPGAGDGQGTAYVFERRGVSWFEVQKLTPTGATPALFGSSIALQGETALVGAPGEDEQAGEVFVFMRDTAGQWVEVQRIPAPRVTGRPDAPGFGTSVALSRDLAVVGSPFESQRGAAYVFERGTDGVWRQVWRLFDENAEEGDMFGASVAIERFRAIVGAPSAGSGAGLAYVFEPVAIGVWELLQELEVADRAVEGLGTSVELDENTAIVGAIGSAHVFTRDPATRLWSERDELRPAHGAGTLFGAAVGWDGMTAVVGASHADTPIGDRSGSSYVFALGRFVDALLPATLNPTSRTKATVTILGSADLDVTLIDVRTLRLGPGNAPPIHDLSDPIRRADGYVDLIVHFRPRRAAIACTDEPMTILTGRMLDGSMIQVFGTFDFIGCRSANARNRTVPRDR